jgi:hypothetical protein
MSLKGFEMDDDLPLILHRTLREQWLRRLVKRGLGSDTLRKHGEPPGHCAQIGQATIAFESPLYVKQT